MNLRVCFHKAPHMYIQSAQYHLLLWNVISYFVVLLIFLFNTHLFMWKDYTKADNYFNRLGWKDFFSCHSDSRGSVPPPLYNKKALVKARPKNNKLHPDLVAYIRYIERNIQHFTHLLCGITHYCFFD
jgi:hypothetical protein